MKVKDRCLHYTHIKMADKNEGERQIFTLYTDILYCQEYHIMAYMVSRALYHGLYGVKSIISWLIYCQECYIMAYILSKVSYHGLYSVKSIISWLM